MVVKSAVITSEVTKRMVVSEATLLFVFWRAQLQPSGSSGLHFWFPPLESLGLPRGRLSLLSLVVIVAGLRSLLGRNRCLPYQLTVASSALQARDPLRASAERPVPFQAGTQMRVSPGNLFGS